MLFKDYKQIELLEGLSVSASRTATLESKQGKNTITSTKIVDVKKWKPTKEFRLRVTATVRKSGKRSVRKEIVSFAGDTYMVDALKLATAKLQELKDSLKAPTRDAGAVDEMPLFKDAFMRALDTRKTMADANNEKYTSYNDQVGFYNKHLTSLGDLKLDEITRNMVDTIRANMVKTTRDGKPILVDGKTVPLSQRTKFAVLQAISPVYAWLEEETEFMAKNPAKQKGVRLQNKRTIQVDDIAPLFKALHNYPIEPFRSIFTWLLHGRRLNEILSLEWSDINFKQGTYMIRAVNNKAKVDMTYILTPYLLKTLEAKKKSGYVFPAINDSKKQMVQATLNNHWRKVRDAVLGDWTLNKREATSDEFHLHDIRHLIGGALINNGTPDEITGAVLGHTRSSITSRYADIQASTANDALMKVLNDVI